MADTEFTRRKAIGTRAELHLRDLLTAYGAVAICNQHNHDATADHPGAAVAHATGGTLHLPDLSVIWPLRGTLRRYGVEVKAKSPLASGGWGWDVRAFDRAVAWSATSGDAVFYVIRDQSSAPMPPAGVLDDPEHWHAASVWKLLHSPTRSTVGQYHYWAKDEFIPLVVLLDGTCISAATVPFIPMDGGRPPLLL